jgi:hypothetical protein
MTTLSEAARAHVDALTRAWLGIGRNQSIPQLPDDLARRLLRIEEHEHAHRDQWGNWEFGLCAAFRAGRLWEPDIDRWLLDTRRELGGAAGPLWPDGRPFAICVSHDVDLIAETVTPRQALRSMRLSLLGAGASRRERITRLARPGVRAARAVAHGLSRAPAAEALERCVELERERGVTASYFFTVYPGSEGHRYDCTYALGDRCRFGGARVTVADVARRLDAEGFEMGLHGSYHSAFAGDRLTAEKEELEQATGLPVTSIRQHFLHWDARVTPHLHARAGFTADSTLGFNRNIGFRAGTSLPFRWFDVGRDAAVDLVELPMLVGDVALLRADALELGPELAEETLLGRLDGIAEVGGVATLNCHPNNLVDPDYLRLFRRAIAYGTERGAWFASVRELDAWFRGRAA